MARNINLSIVENIFNDLGEINLEPKIYEQIEKELQFEGRDKRFHLFVEAGTNKSTLFKFMKQRYYVYYDYSINKRKAEYNNR